MTKEEFLNIYKKYQKYKLDTGDYSKKHPVDRDLLRHIISKIIDKNEELHTIDLNWLDVSDITDMSNMFYESEFNGDISKWNVSNVIDMKFMFYKSEFNRYISKWDVSNVTNMSGMFEKSKFNGDISKWDVSNVTNMYAMFCNSEFNGNISKWDVSNVTNMHAMFANSKFNGDISQWNVSNVTDIGFMFDESKFNRDDYFVWNIKSNIDLDKFHPEKGINDYEDYLRLKKEKFRDINFIFKYFPIIISKIC